MGLESKFSHDHDIIMKNILHHQADETIIFVFPWRSTYQQIPPRKASRSPETPQQGKNENILQSRNARGKMSVQKIIT